MKTLSIKLLTTAAAIAIATSGVAAQDHSKMDHSKMGRGAPAGAIESPAAKAFTA